MKIENLLKGVKVISSDIKKDEEIKGIAIDSRKVEAGFAFICFEGTKSDGHLYINEAIKNGATFIIIQKEIETISGVNVIKIEGGRAATGQIACNFYKNPSKEFKLIGITGTKGKTTTTYMVKSILEAKGLKIGLIGTIESKIGEKRIKVSDNTTPDAIELQRQFRVMADEKVDAVVMEVSSHALDLERIYGCEFEISAFTNLSQDHMDYHKNFENYFNAKKKLFSISKLGIVNIDSDYGKRMYDEINCKKKTFGVDGEADITASQIEINDKNVTFDVNINNEKQKMAVKIPGKFSVYNALTAISITNELGCTFKDMQAGFDTLAVPGRSQIVDVKRDFTVMVDYAHSPDSLKNILTAIKEYAKARIICVFGCGGDRDRTKRPIMGKISGELADYTIITSDNPRSENPDSIIKEIEEGIKLATDKYITITDRAKAIREALNVAKKNDIIIIAGKGHEPYQILKDKTIHFDDREQVLIESDELWSK